MKLEKFERKNKKKIIIGAIIGLILLIGGITLYRTFALYEEKKELDVLKGVIPEFTKGDERGTLIARYPNEESAENEIEHLFWPYRENITKVVFEDTFSEKENASYTFDVEESGSKSVKAYLVAETSDSSMYTLYIQSKGGIIANEDSSYLFDSFTDLETIEGLEYLDTSNVVSMDDMFANTEKLKTLDVSSFETSKVTSMLDMFFNTSVANLDVSHFDTSNVIDMSYMFATIPNLKSIDVSNFDTSQVEYMEGMFMETGITNFDLSHFNTSKVIDMIGMFQNNSNLKSLDVSSFDTSNVQTMHAMFRGCSSLASLDISSFTFESILSDEAYETSKWAEYGWYPKTDLFASLPSNAKVYVKNEEVKQWILDAKNNDKTVYPNTWSESNFIIKT